MPHSRVYKEIMYSELKDWPPPLCTQSKNKDKFCLYHKDHGHYTNECIHLQDAIEKLIRQGKLKQFVQRNDEGASRGRSSSPSRRRGSGPGNGDTDHGRDERRRSRSQSPRRHDNTASKGVVNVIARVWINQNHRNRRGREHEMKAITA
jgi:hypothetical protein